MITNFLFGALKTVFALGAIAFLVYFMATQNGSAAPPRRPSVTAGPGLPGERAAAAYLAAHPQHPARGILHGILLTTSSPGYVCLNGWCRTWHGTVLIPGGRAEHLVSDDGDNGMASLAQPGDLIAFPADDETVDAPADNGTGGLARVIVSGAVAIP